MPPTEHRREDDDARGDRRALLVASGTICVLFAVGASAHSAWLYGQLLPGTGTSQFTSRLLANILMVAVDVVVLVALRIEVRSDTLGRASAVVTAAVVAGVARVAVLGLVGVYEVASPGTQLTELGIGLLAAAAANLLGLAFLTSRQRVRQQAHAAAAGKLQFRLALGALQREEIRVRREVAEGLHGSLQQRLVLLTARIDALTDRLSAGPATPDDIADLRAISGTLDRVREGDVREMSRMLYPDGLEVGMVPAVRSLLVRLPATIGTRLVVSDVVRRLDDPASPVLSPGERLLAVRVVEEAITNALRHGAASSIGVRLFDEGDALRIAVSDDGRGFDVDGVGVVRSGTARLADRLALAGGWLEVRSVVGGGTVLEASLPVTARVTSMTGTDPFG